jgi:undecaprenyl-diphosphatase
VLLDDIAIPNDELPGFEVVPARERLFAAVDPYEAAAVARIGAACERAGALRIAAAATWLGNGWLYPLCSLLVVLTGIEQPLRFLTASLISFGAAFAIYPFLKSSLGRIRPCDLDVGLLRGERPLDHYSCPSGHAMTASAYSVALVFADPAALPLAMAIVLVIGWSRVALGHHYVSDVLLGVVLGAMVAAPVASLLF